MNNSSSLQQISRTGNLDSNLISGQYKLNLMADFMRLEYENPEMKQSENANQLSYSCSTSQRSGNDINMLSSYRIQPNNTKKQAKKVSNTSFDNNSHRDLNVKRLQITSNDLKLTSNESNKNRNKLKGGEPSDSRND